VEVGQYDRALELFHRLTDDRDKFRNLKKMAIAQIFAFQ